MSPNGNQLKWWKGKSQAELMEAALTDVDSPSEKAKLILAVKQQKVTSFQSWAIISLTLVAALATAIQAYSAFNVSSDSSAQAIHLSCEESVTNADDLKQMQDIGDSREKNEKEVAETVK